MAQRGKPLGNKRQHEQAKARKKRDKEARRAARKGGGLEPENSLEEGNEGEGQAEAADAGANSPSDEASSPSDSAPSVEKNPPLGE